MIDGRLLALQSALLAPLAGRFHRRRINADVLTLAGFGLGVLAAVAVTVGQWPAALAVIIANPVADGVDGSVARLHGPTERGAFLDIALDFVFYALVPLGFALQNPSDNALPAAILLAALIGTRLSFLASSAIAAQSRIQAPGYPRKGIFNLGDLTEGFETTAVFMAMCLWPTAFPMLAIMIAAACAVTTALRWSVGCSTIGKIRNSL